MISDCKSSERVWIPFFKATRCQVTVLSECEHFGLRKSVRVRRTGRHPYPDPDMFVLASEEHWIDIQLLGTQLGFCSECVVRAAAFLLVVALTVHYGLRSLRNNCDDSDKFMLQVLSLTSHADGLFQNAVHIAEFVEDRMSRNSLLSAIPRGDSFWVMIGVLLGMISTHLLLSFVNLLGFVSGVVLGILAYGCSAVIG